MKDADHLPLKVLAGAATVAVLWWIAAPSPGLFQLSTGERDVAWRINTKTGEVSACRAMTTTAPPFCSPFGAQSVPSRQQASQ